MAELELLVRDWLSLNVALLAALFLTVEMRRWKRGGR